MPTILIVEPYDTLRYLLRDVLQELGYVALLAESIDAAWRLPERESVHAAVFSVDSAEGGEEECARALVDMFKASPGTILVVSSTDHATGALPSAVRHLTKPFSSEELRRALEPETLH